MMIPCYPNQQGPTPHESGEWCISASRHAFMCAREHRLDMPYICHGIPKNLAVTPKTTVQMQGQDKKDSMDKDGDGHVSTQEFMEFAKKRECFNQLLPAFSFLFLHRFFFARVSNFSLKSLLSITMFGTRRLGAPLSSMSSLYRNFFKDTSAHTKTRSCISYDILDASPQHLRRTCTRIFERLYIPGSLMPVLCP